MRDQTDIAILREGKLVELHSDSNDEEGFNVGDLYIAKVKKLVPSLNAAFVDVGYEKDAFLHYHDLGPQVHSLNKFLTRTQKGKQQWQLQDFSKEPDIDKDGRIEDILKTNQRVLKCRSPKSRSPTKGRGSPRRSLWLGAFWFWYPFPTAYR